MLVPDGNNPTQATRNRYWICAECTYLMLGTMKGLSMKAIFQQLTILSTLLILGCSTAYMNLRDTNRINLRKLEVGMSPSQVSAIMGSEVVDGTSGKIGNPYKREITSSAENVNHEVFYYYTDHVGNKHWESGMTPIVFKEGELAGVGWNALSQYGLKTPSQTSSVVENTTPTPVSESNDAPLTRPSSTYKSGNVVQMNGAIPHVDVLPIFSPQEISSKLKTIINGSQIKLDSYSTPDEISRLSNYIHSKLGSSSISVIYQCQKKYNSSEQLYDITILPHISSSIKLNAVYAKNANGILLNEEREFTGTYVGGNPFGVTKEISKYKINETVLGYKNERGYEPISLGSTRKSRIDGYRFHVPIALSIAREQEADINCLIRIKLEPPYLIEYQRVISPTLTTPISADVTGTAIIGRFTEIRVFNQKTQETYSIFQ